MIETKTIIKKINKTTIKESLPVHNCERCGNTKLIHVDFDVDDIDTTWDEEMTSFIDGYFCEKCNHILSRDEDGICTHMNTDTVNDFDIRKTEKKEDPYKGAFSRK